MMGRSTLPSFFSDHWQVGPSFQEVGGHPSAHPLFLLPHNTCPLCIYMQCFRFREHDPTPHPLKARRVVQWPASYGHMPGAVD